jgi:N-acetylmuramoyl-L-alanine amidase
VRLHCDAAAGSGFTVYYPSTTGKSAEGIVGPSASVLAASRRVAVPFHQAMSKSLKGSLKDNGLKTDRATAIGGKQGALTGSIFSHVPVLLVEMVVLTNPKDEAFVASAAGEAKLTEALAAGVAASARAIPPDRTR